MMDAPDPPETPNPYATASAQTSSNVNTAIANTSMANANVYGPTGSSEFTQTGSRQIKEARKNKDGTVMTQRVWTPAVLRQLFRYPFVQKRYARLTAYTGADNERTARLLAGVGFQLEGRLRKSLDGTTDLLVFGLLREDCRFLPKDARP